MPKKTMVCFKCGQEVMWDPAGSDGVLVHEVDGEQDHEADEDHVPFVDDADY